MKNGKGPLDEKIITRGRMDVAGKKTDPIISDSVLVKMTIFTFLF